MNKINLLILIIVGGILSACSSFPANKLADSSWSLESYAGNPLIQDTTVTAFFNADQISGSASCNHYFGNYSIKGEQIRIEDLGWTEMACIDPDGIMNQEQQIMDLLGDSTSFRIEGQKLIINTSSGKQLIFRVAEEKN